MLTHVEITNFKGVGEKVRIPIAPITLLFGANSTGKSTILHALHYAYEVLAHQNLDVDVSERSGNNINLGGFQNLLHNRDLSQELCLALGLDFSEIDIPEFSSSDKALNLSPFVENACVRFAVRWSPLDNKPYVSFYEVEINEVPAARLTVEAGRKEVVALYNMKHPLVKEIWDAQLIDSFEQWLPIQIANLNTAIPKWGERLEYVEREDATYISDGDLILSQVLVGVGSVLAEYLSKLRYIGPIRSIMPRNYEGVKTTSQQDWSDGSAAWDAMLTGSPGFVRAVGGWLESRFESGYRLHLKQYKEVDIVSPIASTILLRGTFDAPEELERYFETLPVKRRLTLVKPETNEEFSLHDVGVGLSQLIPVIATSLLPSSEFVCVEQPELHIHPAMQTVLGDLFASQIADRNCLFLIETHSEHLILRLLRRIRETYNYEPTPPLTPSLTAKDLSVVYVETGEGGGVKLTPVKVSEDGEFETRWPKGFFDERAAELF